MDLFLTHCYKTHESLISLVTLIMVFYPNWQVNLCVFLSVSSFQGHQNFIKSVWLHIDRKYYYQSGYNFLNVLQMHFDLRSAQLLQHFSMNVFSLIFMQFSFCFACFWLKYAQELNLDHSSICSPLKFVQKQVWVNEIGAIYSELSTSAIRSYIITLINNLYLQLLMHERSETQSEGLNRPKMKQHKFQISTEDGCFNIETDQLGMIVKLKTPLKQIGQFLEQYEIYQFKSQATSIGLSREDYRIFQKYVKQTVQKQFHDVLKHTMKSMQQFIMNAQFFKVQRWHYFAKIAQGFKKNCLIRDADCYDFNIKQFDQMYNQTLHYVNIYPTLNDNSISQQIKSRVKQYQQKLETKCKQIEKKMVVVHPFKPQNIKNGYINVNQLFFSYINQIHLETEDQQLNFRLHLSAIHQKISNFYEGIINSSIKAQKKAAKLIHQYNSFCDKCPNTIKKDKIEKKQIVDANYDSYKGMTRQKNYPAITEKSTKSRISRQVKVYDEETSKDQIFRMSEVDNRIYERDKRNYQNEIQKFEIPPPNDYFDCWEHMYDRKKLRKFQFLYQDFQKNRERHQEMAKKQAMIRDLKKYDFIDNRYRNKNEKNNWVDKQYGKLLKMRQQNENEVWILPREGLRYSDPINKVQYRSSYTRSQDVYATSTYLEAKKNADRQKQVKLKYQKYLIDSQNFQKQRRKEQQARLCRSTKLATTRTYTAFAQKIIKITDTQTYSNQHHIKRYGIQISKQLYNNKNYSKLEQFFFYYFKQRLFREYQIYADKNTNPLLYIQSDAKQFSSPQMADRLIKKLIKCNYQTKFYLWGTEILMFQQIKTPMKEYQQLLTCWTFSEPIYGQSLVFQMKRLSKYCLNDNVIVGYQANYNEEDANGMSRFLCKIQLIHRLLFNLHLQPLDQNGKIEKGVCIFGQIINKLTNETELQHD